MTIPGRVYNGCFGEYVSLDDELKEFGPPSSKPLELAGLHRIRRVLIYTLPLKPDQSLITSRYVIAPPFANVSRKSCWSWSDQRFMLKDLLLPIPLEGLNSPSAPMIVLWFWASTIRCSFWRGDKPR